MNYIDLIGFSAGTLTTLAFLPQVIKAWKTKHTKDISLITFMALTIGVFLWLIYGIFIESLPVTLANGISLILVFTMLVLKIIYK